jgi:hypothetical protein
MHYQVQCGGACYGGFDDNSLTTEYPKPCSALGAPVCFPVIRYFKLHIYTCFDLYSNPLVWQLSKKREPCH